MFHQSPNRRQLPSQDSVLASQFQPTNPCEAFAVLRAALESPVVSPETEIFQQKAHVVADQAVLRAQPIPSPFVVLERPALKREVGALDTFIGLKLKDKGHSMECVDDMESLDASVSDEESDIPPEERADRLIAVYEAHLSPARFTPLESALAVTALRQHGEQASDEYARLTAQYVLREHGIDPR